MAAIEVVTTVFSFVLLAAIVGGYVAVAWAPFLLLRRLQPLFRVGPTDQWWVNYLFAALVVGTVHLIAYVGGLFLLGSAVEPAEMALYAGFAIALLWMAVAGVVLPALEYDWKRGGYMTELALLGGAVWYVAVTVVPPIVLQGLYLVRQ